MNYIRLAVGDKVFLLNNNSNKYDRAVADAGENAPTGEILGHYDKLEGQILDENQNPIPNGIYWPAIQKAKKDFEGLIELYNEHSKSLEEFEAKLHSLSNENVGQKRVFLGTLMTISAAVIAGLFFLFSTQYVFSSDGTTQDYALALAKIAGTFQAVFLFCSGSWLTTMLSQEGVDLDRKIAFSKRTRDDFPQKMLTYIRSEESFRKYVEAKIEEEKKISLKKMFDGEWPFIFISSLFAIAALPLILLFLIAGS